MLFTFETRPSDSPFVETVWRTRSERAGPFVSIAEIVHEFGFVDQSHLNRSLKRFIGLTPTQITAGDGAPQLSF